MTIRGLLPLFGFLGTLLIGVVGAHVSHAPTGARSGGASETRRAVRVASVAEPDVTEPDVTEPDVSEAPSPAPTEVLRPVRLEPPGEQPIEGPDEPPVDAPEPPPAADPAAEEPDDASTPMRIPDDWCGTGRMSRRRVRYVDPGAVRRALEPRYGAWEPTGEAGIYRRVVTRSDLAGETTRHYQYGRRKNGAWLTWSREAEWARRRKAGAPK